MQAGSSWPPPARRVRTFSGVLFQICLYSCFQTKMVEKCGCAQYSQPLPPAANYCNYQQHPNWSEWSHLQSCTSQEGNQLGPATGCPVPIALCLKRVLKVLSITKPGLDCTFQLWVNAMPQPLLIACPHSQL